MTTYNPLSNSTFLDAFGANLYSAQQYQDVAVGNTAAAETALAQLFNYGQHTASVSDATASTFVTVGLVLNRAADPTTLLSSSWGERQAALADQAAIWSTYDADPALYAATSSAVAGVVGGWAPLQAATDTGYVSSAADRTIWLTLDPAQFQTTTPPPLRTISTCRRGPATSASIARSRPAPSPACGSTTAHRSPIRRSSTGTSCR